MTASLGVQSVTAGPAASTVPATSTPSAIGGVAPTSQPPVRTNSSQLPTPAARTSTSTSSSASGRGSSTSIISTRVPTRRIPATCISRLQGPLADGTRPDRPSYAGGQCASPPLPGSVPYSLAGSPSPTAFAYSTGFATTATPLLLPLATWSLTRGWSWYSRSRFGRRTAPVEDPGRCPGLRLRPPWVRRPVIL